MYTVQVFDPTPEHQGWHDVTVINELECGWVFAVGAQKYPEGHAALEIAGLLAENTGYRARAFDLSTGRPVQS